MATRQAAGRRSTALDGRISDSDILRRAYLLELARRLLHREPKNARDYAALGARLAKAAHRREGDYDGYYIRAVLEDKNPVTEPLIEAARNLSAELDRKPRSLDYTEVKVRVPPGVNVPEGTIILRDAMTCICGESFIPTIWNQINHTRACAAKRARRAS